MYILCTALLLSVVCRVLRIQICKRNGVYYHVPVHVVPCTCDKMWLAVAADCSM
jgi:hypothetical protein